MGCPGVNSEKRREKERGMAADPSSDAGNDEEGVQYSTLFDWSIFDHEDGVKVYEFAENQMIVQEKVQNRILFRILDGAVRLEGPKKAILAEISSQDYWPIFGEMSALQVMNYSETTCNIIAKTFCRIQMIPSTVFHRVLISNMRNRKRGTLFYENLCRHYVDRLHSFRFTTLPRSDSTDGYKGMTIRHELVMYFWDCYTKSRFVRTNYLLCLSSSFLALIKSKSIVHESATTAQETSRKHHATPDTSRSHGETAASDYPSMLDVTDKKGSVIWELSKLRSVVAAKDRRICVTTQDGLSTFIHVKDDDVAIEVAAIVRSLLVSTSVRSLRATESIVEVLGFTGLNAKDVEKIVERGRSEDYLPNTSIWEVGEQVSCRTIGRC